MGNHLSDEALEKVCGIPSLKSLFLAKNNLARLPNSIKNLHNLESINLENNSLPSDELNKLSPLKSLQSVILFRNDLHAIPEALLSLPHLEILDLSENPIAESELRKICSIKTLVNLYLNTMHLQRLPVDIGNLKGMKVLSLGNNQLLPTTIESICRLLPDLESLCISNNDVVSLPPAIQRMLKLERLDVRSNPFLNDEDALAANYSLVPHGCEFVTEDTKD